MTGIPRKFQKTLNFVDYPPKKLFPRDLSKISPEQICNLHQLSPDQVHFFHVSIYAMPQKILPSTHRGFHDIF